MPKEKDPKKGKVNQQKQFAESLPALILCLCSSFAIGNAAMVSRNWKFELIDPSEPRKQMSLVHFCLIASLVITLIPIPIEIACFSWRVYQLDSVLNVDSDLIRGFSVDVMGVVLKQPFEALDFLQLQHLEACSCRLLPLLT
jgi:hypothetical protein